MRAFCFIFVVYVFVLLAHPCQEFRALVRDKSEQAVSALNTPGHVPDEGMSSDDCSPFCVCSCCSLNAVSGQSFAMQADPQSDLKAAPRVINRYRTPSTSTYQDSIWQPPKA